MKILNTVLFFLLLGIFTCVQGQDLLGGKIYQIPYDRPQLSVCDTVRYFFVNDYNGYFVSCINLLKSGKIIDFDIVRLELHNNSVSYSFRGSVEPFHQYKKEYEYPDTVRMVYSAIDSLINNRLYINIKDTTTIYTDTISVIWGRSIGK